jgi:RNA polymerase sigma factor (sigma-70 family)
VPDPASLRDFIERHYRRLCHYARALMPDAAEADATVAEAILRIGRQSRETRADDLPAWAQYVARQVVTERRKALSPLPFSDDLLRQLAESAEPVLTVAERRSAVLGELLNQLPPPDRDLLRRKYEFKLSPVQMGQSEGRPATAVARDVAGLHASLISALRQSVRDDGPAAPADAVNLARLFGQLLDGTMSADGRVVVETLLLADPMAQAYYHRHVALVVDLEWTIRGVPPLPALTEPTVARKRITTREWAVTAAFLAACAGALALGAWAVASYLR